MNKIHNAEFERQLEGEYALFIRNAEKVRWSPEQVPYDQIDYSKLGLHDLFGVFVTLHIENYSDVYTQGLLKVFADTPLVCDFIRNWEREEENHARVLERYLTTAGISLEELRTSYAKVNKADFPFPSDNPTGLNTFVFIQELMTREMYSKMLKNCREPVLQGILKKIVRDEERHYRFYKAALELRIQLDPRDSYRRIGKTIREFGMPQTMFNQLSMTDKLMEYYCYETDEILAIAVPVLKLLEASETSWFEAFPKLQQIWKTRRAAFYIVRSNYVWRHLAASLKVRFKMVAVRKRQERQYVQSVVDRLQRLLNYK